MKRVLILILAAIAMVQLSAKRKVNTLRTQLTPLSTMEELLRNGTADTLRYADRITFSGYSKTVNDATKRFSSPTKRLSTSRACV